MTPELDQSIRDDVTVLCADYCPLCAAISFVAPERDPERRMLLCGSTGLVEPAEEQNVTLRWRQLLRAAAPQLVSDTLSLLVATLGAGAVHAGIARHYQSAAEREPIVEAKGEPVEPAPVEPAPVEPAPVERASAARRGNGVTAPKGPASGRARPRGGRNAESS